MLALETSSLVPTRVSHGCSRARQEGGGCGGEKGARSDLETGWRRVLSWSNGDVGKVDNVSPDGLKVGRQSN